MENASKAVLIAGAVLVTILVVSISIFIYTKVSSTAKAGVDSMSATEMAEFNNQFLKYEGRQPAANILELIEKMRTIAIRYKDYVVGNKLNAEGKKRVPSFNLIVYCEDKDTGYKGYGVYQGWSNTNEYNELFIRLNNMKERIQLNKMYEIKFQYRNNGNKIWIRVEDLKDNDWFRLEYKSSNPQTEKVYGEYCTKWDRIK